MRIDEIENWALAVGWGVALVAAACVECWVFLRRRLHEDVDTD